jgi:hypothetical protein
LAKIERVDLREAWPNEAQNFTPWLAENIDELGEALGMDLEVEQTEAPVGGYSLDILATDLNSNRPVIIENQLEVTDHTHLGQLLTYAAGFDAGVIVWVTREFRDEHRQALDWLNQRTGEDTQFFGVAVELWRIAGSPPAPNFRLASTPNGWRKSQVRSTGIPRVLSARQELSRAFRLRLIERAREYGISPHTARGDSPAPWLIFEYPVPKVRYAAIWHNGIPGFEMIIEKTGSDGRDWNLRLFQELEHQKTAIETGIFDDGGDEWFMWEATGAKQRSRVAIYRNGNVYDGADSWDEIQGWAIAKLERFREAFKPYLETVAE